MDPADAHQPRRTVVWLLLALLAVAVVLGAVLLLNRDQAAGAPVKTGHGETTQGRPFQLGIDAEKRPATFDTTLVALCPNGRRISMPWDPVDGDGVVFRRDGDRLRVAERGDGWELELDGRVDAEGGLRGAMSLVVHIRPKTKAPFDCAAKDVRFSAHG